MTGTDEEQKRVRCGAVYLLAGWGGVGGVGVSELRCVCVSVILCTCILCAENRGLVFNGGKGGFDWPANPPTSTRPENDSSSRARASSFGLGVGDLGVVGSVFCAGKTA